MFEKCGLRDLFCKIARLKWVMLIIVIVFTCIGAASFAKDTSAFAAYKAAEDEGEHKVYCGYAFYYVSVETGNTSNARIRQIASNYIGLMKLAPTKKAIYKSMLENHSEEELGELLGEYKYKEGLNAIDLWNNNFKLAYLEDGYILRLTTIAETKSMCEELMKICRKQLESIAKGLPDSQLTYEGANFARNTVRDTTIKAPAKPDYKDILMWLAIGIVAALLYAVISAVLRPVINRPEDFELYGVKPAGLADKKTAAIAARLLEKRTAGTAGSIVLATSLKNDKKVREFIQLLAGEWKKINDSAVFDQDPGKDGFVIRLAEDPAGSPEASDICSSADRVFAIERKGATTHSSYDSMIHYLELIDKKPEEAILIR